MGAVHRRNIGLYGACGDLVRHGAAAAERVDRAGHGALAAWLQGAVVAVVSALTADRDPEPALDRAEQALAICARRLGTEPEVLRGLAAAARVRSWWRFDPVRDGRPPTVCTQPVITVPPDESRQG